MSTGNGTGSTTGNEVIDLRSRRSAPSAAAELHDEWGRLSRERVGLSRQHWHHPVTTDLLLGALRGEDVRPALVRLGEARASAGVSLADTLADLATFCDVLTAAGAAVASNKDCLTLAATVGTAWAETYYGDADPPTCIDELTGLVTAPFLEARLEQIYRHCSYLGTPPADAYALVVAQISRDEASPFTRVARRLRLAGDLRLCFPGSDTLAVLEPTESSQTMVALTSRGADLATAVGLLGQGQGGRHVRVEALPADVADAISLVRGLAIGARPRAGA